MLLKHILRDRWGFDGYVTSDCGAVGDLVTSYHLSPDYAHAAALALEAGVDTSCGSAFLYLGDAVRGGFLSESLIDAALRHLYAVQFRLGMFDPAERVPYSSITIADNDTAQHAAVALEAARKSIVLLKNTGVLPLPETLTSIAVIGPNADSVPVLLGNYNGTPSAPVTVLQGIRAKVGASTQVRYARGCDYVEPSSDSNEATNAIALAKAADVIIFVGGISAEFEGEEGDDALRGNLDGFSNGDRTKIELPRVQEDLLQALFATGKPVVYVQMSGSAIASVWEAKYLPAIVQAWYPGEAGGTAVADVLFGDYNPAGRLPVTFYASTADLPPFTDYTTKERTYRYFRGTPLYPFGHGLSYTQFTYSNLRVTHGAPGMIYLRCTVKNTGERAGDEVVQVYVRLTEAPLGNPLRQLCAFDRVPLASGESRTLSFAIPAERFSRWSKEHTRFEVFAGTYEFEVGASSADIRLSSRIYIA